MTARDRQTTRCRQTGARISVRPLLFSCHYTMARSFPPAAQRPCSPYAYDRKEGSFWAMHPASSTARTDARRAALLSGGGCETDWETRPPTSAPLMGLPAAARGPAPNFPGAATAGLLFLRRALSGSILRGKHVFRTTRLAGRGRLRMGAARFCAGARTDPVNNGILPGRRCHRLRVFRATLTHESQGCT